MSHSVVVGTVVSVLWVLECMDECAGSVMRSPNGCLLDVVWMTRMTGVRRASAGDKLVGRQ